MFNSAIYFIYIKKSFLPDINQQTVPAELPIAGDPFTEIVLDLVFPKGRTLFELDGKRLQLLEPLDRDAENISHVVFQLTCLVKSSHKKRTIPVIVRVSDINDNAPEFINTPYETTVSELTPVGTTVFTSIAARDGDTGVNGQVEYFIIEGNKTLEEEGTIGRNTADGYGYFSINLPHQGQVTINRSLDYERTQRYLLTVLVSDRARKVAERFSSTTTLTINIQDGDDQDPSFIYQGCMLLDGTCINPEYTASVSSGVLSGILNVAPEKIQAVDMDTINSPIQYSFVSGMPTNYKDFFEINPTSGAVRQIKAVDTAVSKKFDITIKAQEVSEAKKFTTAKLSVTVKPVDASPPEIHASFYEGFVNENAPVGTEVMDRDGNPLVLTVTDDDLGTEDPKPIYKFELTTPFFRIGGTGVLLVNEENLDRDPPSPGRFRFQVVAREKGGSAASAPISLTVVLRDVNDNAPILPSIVPITVQAGDARRQVATIRAMDKDEGDNAKITYSIYHVSNNGLNKFKIDPISGLLETIGKLNAGDQYSVTVQATDTGGLHSQTIVEVSISPGPNTRSPQFQQYVYEVEVSEGASINSTVATVTAIDPENDPVAYSIISGNDFRQFAIGAKTGVISVIRKLDREELTRYQLVIKAKDPGRLSSTSTVNIKITDINDKNPEFENAPYEFEVKEGRKNETVGSVHATDADEGINALISYSIPHDVPFKINMQTGEIVTKMSLDYETQKEYQFVVTARDNAPDSRLATASVTVNIIDIEDEFPIFHRTTYEAVVPENVPDFMVGQVLADDPDTIKAVTYVLRQGPNELFRIDPRSGAIFTTRGLDFEKDNQHVLIVGTLENPTNEKGSTTRFIVNVEDRNDIPPVFTSIPRPITVDDEVSIGTTVTNLIATDSDGTAPGNKVRYELIGRGKSSKFFQIDPDTGVVIVRDDLRKETDSEYTLDIRAYDLGEPQLSTTISIGVYVRHVATVAPEVGLGFVDDTYSIKIPENTPAGSLLKNFTIVNSHAHSSNIPLKCFIISDNKDVFHVNITSDRTCALYLSKQIDYEDKENYEIELQLESLQGFVNPMQSNTMVSIHVIDVNDNKPSFIYPDLQNEITNGKFYAALPHSAPLTTTVMQIKVGIEIYTNIIKFLGISSNKNISRVEYIFQAEDDDSGKYGKLQYRLVGEGNSLEYFNMDPNTGLIKSRRSFDDISDEDLPFRMKVQARDNPNASSDFNMVEAPLVINLISEKNLMILVIGDAKPDMVAGKEDAVVSVLQEHSGLLVGVDKLATRQYLGENGTLESDASGTDVWFYAIDPETETILETNHTRVQRSIFDKAAMNNITFDISGLVKHTAFNIHEPLVVHKTRTAVTLNAEVFPYALIIIACLIFVLGFAGIIYICISWSRYVSKCFDLFILISPHPSLHFSSKFIPLF